MPPDFWNPDKRSAIVLWWIAPAGSDIPLCATDLPPDMSVHVATALDSSEDTPACDAVVIAAEFSLAEKQSLCRSAQERDLPLLVILAEGEDAGSELDALSQAGADLLLPCFHLASLLHGLRRLVEDRRHLAVMRDAQVVQDQARRMLKIAHWHYDLENKRFRMFNGEVFGLEGLEHSQLDPISLTRSLSARVPAADLKRITNSFRQAISDGQESLCHYRWHHDDGQWRWVEMQLTRSDGPLLQINGLCVDVSERYQNQREITRMAYYDPLTGLRNRVLLERCVDELLAETEGGSSKVAFFYFDIDHFSRINNVLGHDAGDELLRLLAARLCEHFKACGTPTDDMLDSLAAGYFEGAGCRKKGLGRLAADSFGLFFRVAEEESACRETVDAMADELLALFNDPFLHNGQAIYLAASIGISVSRSGDSARELIQQADLALHEAKAAGRCCSRYYLPDMMPRLSQSLQYLDGMKQALMRREFSLFYQPRVSADGRRLLALEALLRWSSPEMGMVPPATFIPLAEESGQIVEIGDWVFEQACQQLVAWQQGPLAQCKLSVNVSARQLRTPGFVDHCADQLRRSGVEPSRIELEITEGVLIDSQLAGDALGALRALGLGISLDDFGTGYCSLSYLLRFPITAVKLDRSFVRQISQETEKAAVVGAVTQLAHTLKMDVVAEGVEDIADWQALQSLGCDQMQGFYFARPMPATELECWLETLTP